MVGLSILLHVILKNRRPQEPPHEDDEVETPAYGTLTKDFVFDDIDFDYDSDQ